MERLGARDLPCVMFALRRLIGSIVLVLLSAMVVAGRLAFAGIDRPCADEHALGGVCGVPTHCRLKLRIRWAFQSFLCVENVEGPPIFVAAVGWLGSGRDGPGWRVAWCRVIGHLSVCAALRWPAQPTIFDR